MTTALILYQRALDAVSDAVLAGDFAAYLAMIDLPYLIRTAEGTFLLQCEADLRPAFNTLSWGLRARGVTHYERVARGAVFDGEGWIAGHHFTHMIAGGQRIIAPHPAKAVIVLRGAGLWRFTKAHYPHVADWPPTDHAVFGADGGQSSTPPGPSAFDPA